MVKSFMKKNPRIIGSIINMFNREIVKELSTRYNIEESEIKLIALNRFGIKSDIPDNRIRFLTKVEGCENAYYFAICVNTTETPFELKDDKIYFDGEVFADIIKPEKDTCDTTYFRRNRTELTLNSNRRSNCRGCKFCGTYALKPEDEYFLNTEEKLSAHFEVLLKENNMKDLSNIVRITVCTGCFGSEEELVNHLIMVYNVAKKYGFSKRIRYIGSQIRSKEAMLKIKDNIPYFSLSLTIECFSRRQELMKPIKANVTLDDMKFILSTGKALGFSVNYLYILGLEPLNIMKENFIALKPYINRFPVVQVLQDYTAEQEDCRCDEGKTMEYYLQARLFLEDLYKNVDYRPRSWENYRSLFYETFNHEKHISIKK